MNPGYLLHWGRIIQVLTHVLDPDLAMLIPSQYRGVSRAGGLPAGVYSNQSPHE
jgi:hypothetical protein